MTIDIFCRGLAKGSKRQKNFFFYFYIIGIRSLAPIFLSGCGNDSSFVVCVMPMVKGSMYKNWLEILWQKLQILKFAVACTYFHLPNHGSIEASNQA